MSRPVALVLGPSLAAISGVTTHVNALLDSRLGEAYRLVHFQVGSEGRDESALGRLGRFIGSPFALAAAILRHDAGIVHVNSSLNAKAWWRDLAYLLAAKLCGARVVFQKHGGDLVRFSATPGFAPLVRWALGLADAVVVLSRRELHLFRSLVPGQRIVAVPNGIDAAPYLRRPRAATDPSRPLSVAYIGRLAPGKGLAESLQAIALLRAEGIEVAFTIAGTGAEETRLRDLAGALGVADLVCFAGPALGERKSELLAAADVLLLASYSEGLPYALLEGMAAGAVPVVTPVGAIPEVVADGVHGRLVPVADARAIARALGALHAERAALGRMSQACRSRVARAYSLERVAQDFIALYSSLIPWPASQAG